jgi:fucose permease
MSWWRSVVPQPTSDSPVNRVSLGSVLRMPAVWMGIAMFFLYAGLEATPGQWVFPLFTQVRGIDEVSAGQWVSIYWGSFTIGRIFFGAIITRVQTLLLLRLCLLGALSGALLLWWNPAAWVGFAGLTLLGFSQAPLFPVLISNTPKRVGALNAPNAIGFQVAGAGVGIAALPALAGILANNISLEIIPPFIVTAGVLMIVLHELSVAQSARIQETATAAAGD